MTIISGRVVVAIQTTDAHVCIKALISIVPQVSVTFPVCVAQSLARRHVGYVDTEGRKFGISRVIIGDISVVGLRDPFPRLGMETMRRTWGLAGGGHIVWFPREIF